MNRLLSICLSLALVFGSACASISARSGGGADKKATAGKEVTEDLSAYRPKYPAADASDPAASARLPDEKDYLTYQQPNFRLKVGDFFSRIEAQQVLNQIADLIPNAQIVQDQININKTY